jgi:two-component system, chemotaxis family, chemotaxis protein CheY
MKTLVAEDDFISRLVLQKMLLPFGQCDVAVNGVEAVQAFSLALSEGLPYDLICLDIMMPELDGKEALKAIRLMEKEKKVSARDEAKIIMITALDTPKDVVEAYYKGGCTSYLVKPINKVKISEALKDINLI